MADTIYKYLMDDGRFKNFIRILDGADDLKTSLNVNGKVAFTVFAPTDDAFVNEKLIPGTLEKWFTDGDILLDIARFHMIYNEHPSEELKELAKDNKPINAADNNPLTFTSKNGDLLVGNEKKQVKISQPDVKASNGIIHVINDLMTV